MTSKNTNLNQNESTDFFETMPMMADHYIYRDDAVETSYQEPDYQNEIRRTAIITLIMVAAAAIALGLLAWQGLGTIKGSLSPLSNSSSYEL